MFTIQVLRHIVTKGTPPPKVWWVPPTGLHSCLRTALRYLNIPIVSKQCILIQICLVLFHNPIYESLIFRWYLQMIIVKRLLVYVERKHMLA